MDLNLSQEEQIYLDGMRAGIRITLKSLRQKLPEFFDNLQFNMDILLEQKGTGKTADEYRYN